LFGRVVARARVGAWVEAGGAYEGGPFGAMWSRSAAVEEIGSNVGDFVAEGLQESLARPATEPSR
jgi:hypothetical protein